MSRTHEVLNQPPPLVDHDLAGADPLLADSTRRDGGEWALDQIVEYGRTMASAEVIEWGDQANRNEPVLHTHDTRGVRCLRGFPARRRGGSSLRVTASRSRPRGHHRAGHTGGMIA